MAGLRFIPPLSPTLVDEPPEGPGWIHEIKYDGYRTQLVVQAGTARAYTRNGHNWSARYAPIVKAAEGLACAEAIIDGELIVQDTRGRSDFHALKAAIERAPERLVLMAFDLLHLDGEDLRRRPLSERRARLAELLGPNDPAQPIHFSEDVADGAALFAAADEMGLEGIVSKKATSRYRSGTSKAWLKTKTFTQDEFVVIGTSKGDRAPVALLARSAADGSLSYAGAAMVTLPQPARDRFWEAIDRIRVPQPAIPMEARKETGWAAPAIRVRAKFLRGEEMLRHATLTALIEVSGETRRSVPASTRLEPPLPNPKIDQEALLAYYDQVAPILLPWVERRPLNLLRCEGRSCRFQRNESHPPADPGTFPPNIGRLPVLQKNGKLERYLYVADAAGVRACVEAGAVEFHGWGSQISDVETPDRIVIDLDPSEELDFAAVKRAAFEVRDAFDALELASFAMLSGGKGVHVIAPLSPAAQWPEVRAFARDFCQRLADVHPDRYTIALPKAERRGRIFLDFLRNQRTSTAVLPYSARARPGAPVAAPVTWHELESFCTPAAFTIADVAVLKRRAKSRTFKGWGIRDQLLPVEYQRSLRISEGPRRRTRQAAESGLRQ